MVSIRTRGRSAIITAGRPRPEVTYCFSSDISAQTMDRPPTPPRHKSHEGHLQGSHFSTNDSNYKIRTGGIADTRQRGRTLLRHIHSPRQKINGFVSTCVSCGKTSIDQHAYGTLPVVAFILSWLRAQHNTRAYICHAVIARSDRTYICRVVIAQLSVPLRTCITLIPANK